MPEFQTEFQLFNMKELFKNEDDLNEITKKIIKIIHIFSKSPFTTQEEISFKL